MTKPKRTADPEQSARARLRNDPSYTEAKRRESEARTKLLEQRLARERGELLPKKEALAQMAAQIVAARAKLLGVRRKLQARHPGLPKEVLDDIESLHREAMQELANET